MSNRFKVTVTLEYTGGPDEDYLTDDPVIQAQIDQEQMEVDPAFLVYLIEEGSPTLAVTVSPINAEEDL